jgi:Zn-finger protein
MLKNKCGGNFKYTKNVKDCSDCLVPHSEGAYDYVTSKMPMIIKIGREKE